MKTLLVIIVCFCTTATFAQKSKIKQHADSVWAAQERQIKIDDSIATAEDQKATLRQEKADERHEQMLQKKYGMAAYKKAVDGKVWIGMTAELCERAVGPSHRTRRVVTKNKVTEEWYDIGDSYYVNTDRSIFFTNGVVTSIIEHE